MDSELYVALTEDDFGVLRGKDWPEVRDQLTPANNTVLHVACQHGSISCVTEILRADESVLLKTNSRGETALHLAARQGHYDTVSVLIRMAKIFDKRPNNLGNTTTALQNLIRASNVEFETALHAAVRYNHQKVVELLVRKDPGFAYPRNKFDETPLYLAAVRGYDDVTQVILDNCDSPTFGGPHGRTALHAAAMSYTGHGCMKLLMKRNEDLINVADNDGWTAFHFAADNNQCYSIELLLGVNKYVAHLPDQKYKKTALHIAAYKGYHKVVEQLLKYLPDAWESVDGNGQNILHIAVQQYKKPLLKFILSKTQKFDILNTLIIQRDQEGNTPLHLAAKFGYNIPEIGEWLQKIDHYIVDNTNLAPSDVIYRNFYNDMMNEEVVGVYSSKDQIHDIWNAWTQGRVQATDRYEPIPAKEKIMMRQQMANSHMIVAALVTTVALTAGFTVPGGFDSNRGSPLLLRKPAFKIFMIADTLALLFSISALFLYFSISFKHTRLSVTFLLLTSAVVLNVISIAAMMVAFIAGTFAVLYHSLALAIIVSTLSSLFLLLIFSFSVPFIRSYIPVILQLYGDLRGMYSSFKYTLGTFLRRILNTRFRINSRPAAGTNTRDFSAENIDRDVLRQMVMVASRAYTEQINETAEGDESTM
ncbi:ankyrin repeat-containing protein At5g02620-like isoform X1 [Daucus carota subsp. sativus]|uniref:ankyrin repeat-containing protein At5g02620-like isoform X1 n=1 Tax=Daucus carota subsp. sativus TaxID=79200 RepID=UPI0007EF27F5|nr:PREDICTED: ankyrin repeat-containing protein At5g02620-like isoform X1 [Daucus carota subsp. sativus]